MMKQSDLQIDHFSEFFHAIYGYLPFPWQQLLAQKAFEQGRWPEGIDLPTSSGKTACIDIAVFLMALGEQAGRLSSEGPGRRRVFFVVDRRIVVDEAYQRACALAEKLQRAIDDNAPGIVGQVARKLQRLAGDHGAAPLVASRLRGGTVRDTAWKLNPAQAAIITGTVDQIGSRLLFRGYGTGAKAAPIDAALVACDSLIFLDEAHCAVPFMQTVRAVQRYASPAWTVCNSPVAPPLAISILSATLPDQVPAQARFPNPLDPSERQRALDHKVLRQRFEASKPARLVEVRSRRGPGDELAAEAAAAAVSMAQSGLQRVAVMVNRVATAFAVKRHVQELLDKTPQGADVVLLTGRMRPHDRDQLITRWESNLRSENSQELPRPIILCTTQCLEVGADFSFDGLVTECAPLDALRQRFGRLNRLGDKPATDAVVLIRAKEHKPDDKLDDAKPLDPIYGNALARTWNWLNTRAVDGWFDFGIAAVDAALTREPDRDALLKQVTAPTPEAPVLLPVHLDYLCQTSPNFTARPARQWAEQSPLRRTPPRPSPDPDPALFLHGPQNHRPEAYVVFRADLNVPDRDHWSQAVQLLPPVSAEALAVPLGPLKRWLAGQPLATDDTADIESQPPEADKPSAPGRADDRWFLLWRGRSEVLLSRYPDDIRPGDTLVVPTADVDWVRGLRHYFTPFEPALGDGSAGLDIAGPAYRAAKGREVLRITPPILQPLQSHLKSASALANWAKDDDRSDEELPDLLEELANEAASNPINYMPWCFDDDLRHALKAAVRPGGKFSQHLYSTGGILLIGPPPANEPAATLDDAADDLALLAIGGEHLLSDHLQHVATWATRFALACLPQEFHDALSRAAWLHDLGKLDPRFQAVLHGDIAAAQTAMFRREYLAKSGADWLSPYGQRRVREQAQLPEGFRHEMLSSHLVLAGGLLDGSPLADLILHLIESHHGYARPFAPVVIDPEPSAIESVISIDGDDYELALTTQAREALPPHRLDSGVARRFWQLTRRYGWWGLAYLETLLRLADHRASAAEMAQQPAIQHQG